MADDQNPTLHRQTLPLSVSLTHNLFHTMHPLFSHSHAVPYTSPQGHTFSHNQPVSKLLISSLRLARAFEMNMRNRQRQATSFILFFWRLI